MAERVRQVPENRVEVTVHEPTIDAVFAGLNQCHLPGAAVGIAIRGKPVYRKGFGLANMELPVVLTPSIRMRIGSTTKHFVALAYLLLCEQGLAAIDDPIGKYLPELHPASRAATARQLMGHVSGLRDVHDICYQLSGIGRTASSADLLSLYEEMDDVNAAVGTTWIYNNGAYLMLSVAVERIAGRPLEQVLRDCIFEPVGMHDTMLRRLDTDFVPRSATLHMATPAGSFDKSYLGVALAGEGGIVSTVDDMLRWLAHMDAPVIGTATTWKLMKTPQTLPNGTCTDYGLGLMWDQYRGVETLSHAGGVLAGNSQMLKVPAASLDVAVMLNRGDVSAMLLTEKILDACLPGLSPTKHHALRANASGRTYCSPTTSRVIQLCVKDGQQVASIDGMDMPVEPDDTGRLWAAGIWRYLKQSLSLVGDVETAHSIHFSDFGTVDELVAVRASASDASDAIEGHYRSESTSTVVTITRNDDGAQLTTKGRFGSVVYKLEFLAPGVWRARHPTETFLGGILTFDKRSPLFRFSTFRTRSLPFRRCG
jgi:D-aminopeptidase